MTALAVPLSAFSGYGIELEYMIVDRDSLTILPIADELLRKVVGSYTTHLEIGRFGWSNELVLHVVEIKNPSPEAHLDALAAGFQAETRRIDELLAEFGAQLMPGAMHPWMNPATETRLWPHENDAIYRAYDHIFDCHAHGWANIQSMHVNLPFANDKEFARLHAAVRLLLPILPALAASSPVADGKACEMLDFRMACYRAHPARVPSLIGQVIPDNSTSRAEYEASVLAPMYQDIAPFDPGGILRHEWLNARGAIPRFDRAALEIRVIDMQECPQADLAIAALASAVTRALYSGRWSTLEAQRRIDTSALEIILLECIRNADHSVIDSADYLALLGFPEGRCEAHELWSHLYAECFADTLFSEASRIAIDTILSRGPLARRIMRALGVSFDRSRLNAVYQELCDCLADGHLFMGPPILDNR
jgi:gamma-glutamyl:cysteine ligase YbdK (ATP-grasp superfamily)